MHLKMLSAAVAAILPVLNELSISPLFWGNIEGECRVFIIEGVLRVLHGEGAVVVGVEGMSGTATAGAPMTWGKGKMRMRYMNR